MSPFSLMTPRLWRRAVVTTLVICGAIACLVEGIAWLITGKFSL